MTAQVGVLTTFKQKLLRIVVSCDPEFYRGNQFVMGIYQSGRESVLGWRKSTRADLAERESIYAASTRGRLRDNCPDLTTHARTHAAGGGGAPASSPLTPSALESQDEKSIVSAGGAVPRRRR